MSEGFPFDKSMLTRYSERERARLDADLAALPELFVDTSNGTERLAEDVARKRLARQLFLQEHIDAVYDVITRARSQSIRVEHLVHVASIIFPKLLPSAAEMENEARRRQADKLGLAIDQALFVKSVLASAVAGPHLLNSMLAPTEYALSREVEFAQSGQVRLNTVVVERRGEIGHVTFANLEVLNAEDMPLLRDLETAVDLVLLDPNIRVGILRGGIMTHSAYSGRRVFCAGLNLKALREGRIPLVEYIMARELGLINKLRRGLLITGRSGRYGPCVEKPWIAGVDSFAIGGGVQMLLAVDHVVSASDATFSLPASKEGFIPGAANLRLTRFTGARLCRRMILDGKKISAQSSDASMICDVVVKQEDMESTLDQVAARFSSEAILANRHILIQAEESIDELRRYLSEFALVQALRLNSSDVATAAGTFRSGAASPRGAL